MRISVALRREIKASQVTVAQSAVMSALMVADAMRVSDLARNEGVTLPTMTQIVGRMEAAGWVSRAAPAGTYNNLLRITPEGAALANQLAVQRNQALAERMADLETGELDLIQKVVPILDKMFIKEPWRDD